MTLAEFKSWFEGFSEMMEAAPNEKQWERIKARVAEINGTVTTYPVFIDRYVQPYRYWWENGPSIRPLPTYYSSATPIDAKLSAAMNADYFPAGASQSEVFDAGRAMMDLGKAEYRSLDS